MIMPMSTDYRHPEGINQRNLKLWAEMADKICFDRPKNLGLGLDFRPCSEGDFPTGCP